MVYEGLYLKVLDPAWRDMALAEWMHIPRDGKIVRPWEIRVRVENLTDKTMGILASLDGRGRPNPDIPLLSYQPEMMVPWLYGGIDIHIPPLSIAIVQFSTPPASWEEFHTGEFPTVLRVAEYTAPRWPDPNQRLNERWEWPFTATTL